MPAVALTRSGLQAHGMAKALAQIQLGEAHVPETRKLLLGACWSVAMGKDLDSELLK